MATRFRNKSKAQGDRDVVRYQQSFSGGQNSDEHPGILAPGEMSSLKNLYPVSGRLAAIPQRLDYFTANMNGFGNAATTGSVIQYGIAYTTRCSTLGRTYMWALARLNYAGTADRLYLFIKGTVETGGAAVNGWDAYFNLSSGYIPADSADSVRIVQYDDGLMITSDQGELVRVVVYEQESIFTPGVYYYAMTQPFVMNDSAGTVGAVIGPEPDTCLWWDNDAGTSGTIEHSWDWKITYGYKDSSGLVVWESAPISTQGPATPGGFPIRMTSYLDIDAFTSGEIWLDLSKMVGISDNPRNFTRLWRTLDIGALADMTDAESSNALTYRLEYEQYTPSGVVPTILNYGPSAASPTPFVSDAILATRQILPVTSAHAPMPCGGELAYSRGFLYTSVNDTLYYSTTGDRPEHVGYYFQGGPAQLKDRGDITGIYPAEGFVLVATLSSLRRISTETTLDVGLGGGIYEPIFQFTPYVSEVEGVPGYAREAVVVIGSEIILLTSSHQVAIYDGTSLGTPVSYGKVSKYIREAGNYGKVVGVYSPERYYQLWWMSSAAVPFIPGFDRSMRCSFLTEGGVAWSEVQLEHKPILKPCVISQAMDIRPTDESGSYTGILCYHYDAAAVDFQDVTGSECFGIWSITDFDDDVKDLEWEAKTPHYRGEYDSYVCRHEETTLSVNGTVADAVLELTAPDASCTPSSDEFGYLPAHVERIKLQGTMVGAPLSCTRTINNARHVQITLKGYDTTRFELCRLDTLMKVQDRPYHLQNPLDFTGEDTTRAYQLPDASTATAAGSWTLVTETLSEMPQPVNVQALSFSSGEFAEMLPGSLGPDSTTMVAFWLLEDGAVFGTYPLASCGAWSVVLRFYLDVTPKFEFQVWHASGLKGTAVRSAVGQPHIQISWSWGASNTVVSIHVDGVLSGTVSTISEPTPSGLVCVGGAWPGSDGTPRVSGGQPYSFWDLRSSSVEGLTAPDPAPYVDDVTKAYGGKYIPDAELSEVP